VAFADAATKSTKAISCIAEKRADLRRRCGEILRDYDRVADQAVIFKRRRTTT
jgi:hypothetical protein